MVHRIKTTEQGNKGLANGSVALACAWDYRPFRPIATPAVVEGVHT